MVTPVPGMKIKAYTLETMLGKGASGEVWRATDGTKPVAIKFMNESLMNSPAAAKHRQRLEREIKALSMLKHPVIPALYDFDLHSQPPYLVMEFIAEPSYDRLIASGEMFKVPIARRLELLEALAAALTAAHESGIVHRDIKPGNINGIARPYLLDFSIALEQEDIEHTNFNVGTTIYMTPDEEPPDRLSDNYAFAIVAYEVLFGTHPIFPPDDKTRTMGAYTRLQAFQRLKSRDWRFPSRVAKTELPLDLHGANLRELDKIFERAMGPRDKRYVALSQFIADLRGAIVVPENATFMQQAAEEPGLNRAAPAHQDGPITKVESEREKSRPKPIPAPKAVMGSDFSEDADFTREQMALIQKAEKLKADKSAPNFTREMVALDIRPKTEATPENPSLFKRLFGRWFGKKS